MKKTTLIIVLALFWSDMFAQSNRSFEPCYTPKPLDSLKGRANIEANISFAPYDASKPYDLNKGKGEVGYYYATGKTCGGLQQPLTKPIIIIDGFDPGDVRDIANIYGERLAYQEGIIIKNFGDSLRRLGYDVVILNFPKHEVARVTYAEYNAIPHKFMLPEDTVAKAALYPNYRLPVY